MNKFNFALVIACLIFIALLATQSKITIEERHKYEVLKEVAQMQLQGQDEMEVIMNAKSTTDIEELRAALEALKTTK